MDKPLANPTMEEEMRRLHARLYSMEMTQIISPDVGDIKEFESE
jgi:hypothetical protein